MVETMPITAKETILTLAECNWINAENTTIKEDLDGATVEGTVTTTTTASSSKVIAAATLLLLPTELWGRSRNRTTRKWGF